MAKKKSKKAGGVVVLVIIIALVAIGAYYVEYLKKAHSSFENYYAFRGCQTLEMRTDTYGTCLLKDGKEIKIVKYQDKWYLDGDLPGGFLNW